MAARVKGDLGVIHVAGDSSRPRDQNTILALHELAGDLGARWHELPSDDPAAAITHFAREHHITQIAIGSSQRSRWPERVGGGSIVRRIIRAAGEVGIDVHVIAWRELSDDEDPEDLTDDGLRST